MPTTLGRLRRLALLRRMAIPLMAVEAMAVLFEQITGLDPLPNVVDVILSLGGLCALALVGVAEALAGGLTRRIAADEQELAIRREDEAQQRQARRANRERVENIIEGAAYPVMVFQPIVELQTGHTLGYEALSRFGSESMCGSPKRPGPGWAWSWNSKRSAGPWSFWPICPRTRFWR